MNLGPKIAMFERKLSFLEDFQNMGVLWYSRGYDLRLHLTLTERNFDIETSEDFFDMRNVVLRSRGNSEVISGQTKHATVQGQ